MPELESNLAERSEAASIATEAVRQGTSLLESGDVDAAIAAFTEAIRVDPSNADAYAQRGRAFSRKDDPDNALADCTEAIRLNPALRAAYIARGWAHCRKGDLEHSISDYCEAIRLDPQIAQPHSDLGTVYVYKSDFGKAVDHCTEAVRLDPTLANAHLTRGDAYCHLGEHEKAIADYAAAVLLKPDWAEAHCRRGIACEHLREDELALADYCEALRLDPANVEALLNRGQLYEYHDEDELALRDFMEAVRARPDDARPYCERGELWAKLEAYEKAIADLTEAVRLDPANESAYEARGGVFDCLGEFARADEDFQRAEELQTKSGKTMLDQKTNVLTMLEQHFQPVPLSNLTITERRFPERVRADLQRAIDAIVEPMTVHRFCGVRKQHSYHGINFTELVVRDRHDPAVSVPLQYEEVDIGEERPIRCLKTGLWLIEDAATRFALFLEPAAEHGCGPVTIRLQLATINDEAGSGLSRQFYRQLERFVQEARSYRGKILSLEMHDHYSGMSSGIRVHKLRQVGRDQVILSPQTLELLERNVINFVRERPRLSKFGMATKKGLLFYGPPGTGKTHTLHYLAGTLEGMTTLLISAEQVGLLDEYMGLARLLQPSMVVIEDADLIARDREQASSAGAEVLLNKLLNEMDGLREDADILFILTTNRPEAIEAALSSRPGRIDQAIEFPFPDEDGRAKLIRLYSRSDNVPEEVVRATVKKTDNVSAAFIKELMRRAAQFQLERDGSTSMEIADIDNALEEMLFKGGSLNRKLLGGKVEVGCETRG